MEKLNKQERLDIQRRISDIWKSRNDIDSSWKKCYDLYELYGKMHLSSVDYTIQSYEVYKVGRLYGHPDKDCYRIAMHTYRGLRDRSLTQRLYRHD